MGYPPSQNLTRFFLAPVLMLTALLTQGAWAEDEKPVRGVRAGLSFVLEGSPDLALALPTDAAVDDHSRIYVMDGVNHRVVVFDEQGQYLRSFGRPGKGKGELNLPVGISISPAGAILVADTGNHRIQVFSPQGAFLMAFGLRHGDKADPTDVLASGSGDLCYVADNDNHEIQVYELTSGRLVRFWGGHGKNLGQFRYPATLAMDRQGQVYVVDVMNARVQTFDSRGENAREVATWGVGPGQLFRPKGVALDDRRHVFVSDSFMGAVKVFRNSGEPVGLLDDEQGRPRRFVTPTNILIDGKNRLLVVETRANRVSVLALLE